MDPPNDAVALSAEQEAMLKGMKKHEITLWSRTHQFFPNHSLVPPQLLPQNAGFSWEKPHQVITRHLSQLLCVPIFQKHPQLIPIGLDIARFYRLRNPIENSSGSSLSLPCHPLVQAACEAFDVGDMQQARKKLAKALRVATPLGQQFPKPTRREFLFSCKELLAKQDVDYRGQYAGHTQKHHIINGDSETLIRAYNEHAIRSQAKHSEVLAKEEAAKRSKIAHLLPQLIENKRRWMIESLLNPENSVEAASGDVDEDGDSDAEESADPVYNPDSSPRSSRMLVQSTAAIHQNRRRSPRDFPSSSTAVQASASSSASSHAYDPSTMDEDELTTHIEQLNSVISALPQEIYSLQLNLTEKTARLEQARADLVLANQLRRNTMSTSGAPKRSLPEGMHQNTVVSKKPRFLGFSSSPGTVAGSSSTVAGQSPSVQTRYPPIIVLDEDVDPQF
ncbi:hypothetical protein HYFRA_00011003 [Hymenoscyphus fraxineus]|uniref:Uncharacterized protein n=1 Tax=Hymenoscyphus fraxineus TaxID=746836 RepID=A0A9N9L2A2_9HELO|nr:hypothetical protein HYFRA_00011003 [Hymenoscyphus fraxineus]